MSTLLHPGEISVGLVLHFYFTFQLSHFVRIVSLSRPPSLSSNIDFSIVPYACFSTPRFPSALLLCPLVSNPAGLLTWKLTIPYLYLDTKRSASQDLLLFFECLAQPRKRQWPGATQQILRLRLSSLARGRWMMQRREFERCARARANIKSSITDMVCHIGVDMELRAQKLCVVYTAYIDSIPTYLKFYVMGFLLGVKFRCQKYTLEPAAPREEAEASLPDSIVLDSTPTRNEPHIKSQATSTAILFFFIHSLSSPPLPSPPIHSLPILT